MKPFLKGLVLSLVLKDSACRWDGPRFVPSPVRSLPLTLRSEVEQNRNCDWLHISRGGEIGRKVDDDDDEERYSRQVYTLGARAHALVRSATVYIDGPSTSGLTYEAAKNLALSGIGKIVIVTSESSLDDNYHYPRWDDLGKMYVRGARAELGIGGDQAISSSEILVEFLHRLNPSMLVERITREEFEAMKDSKECSGILLCVDRPYDTQIALNKICRERAFPFVAVETAGVYGRTFTDFGPSFDVHDVDGETPAVVPLDRVEVADEVDSLILIRSVEGERHDVSKGDEIRFQLPNGDCMQISCIVTQVLTPEKIIVQLSVSEIDVRSFVSQINSMAASFSRLKNMVHLSFVSLEEATRQAYENISLFTPCDFDKAFDETRNMAVFGSFQSLSTFVKKYKKLPMDNDAINEFIQSTKSFLPTSKDGIQYCELFATKCAAKFVPVQAIFGAIAAQECLKAASGLYNPIRQFLLYDCDEVIDITSINKEAKSDDVDSGLAYIMGEKTTKALRRRKLFVVGAGAIGCEILKNLAAMEAGTGKKGLIVVTDMDTIERSNLSRQLLFRDSDISKFKSKAAEEAIARLNPSVKIQSYTNKVGDTEIGPFDSTFWSEKVQVVLNALDNVDARLYIDAQCVANGKALVDAGTLGSKGNVQVVVPHLSESYASSADPPDPSIPVCTLKNFPYSISHTIHWGRDLFDGLFARRPKQANLYAEVLASSGVQKLELMLRHDHGDEAAEDVAKELAEDLPLMASPFEYSMIRDRSISWAIQLARRLFHDSIMQLLEEHPIDSIDDEGEPFWSGSRKPPTVLKLPGQVGGNKESIDNNLVDFVRHAARLRIETLFGQNADSTVSSKEVRAALLQAGGDRKQYNDKGTGDILNLLKPLKDLTFSRDGLTIAEFEKDDESNGHVAFITAASNLRATCYGIPPVDAMETRRVAGRIVPAMITTTAFVSALSCIELLKLVQSAPLKRYRNSFINLALPFFAFTAPLPAQQVTGLRGQKYSLWDRIIIKDTMKPTDDTGLTMRRLLKRLKKKSSEDPDSIEIASISYGQYLIFANFLNDDDEDLLKKDLWTVVKEAVASGKEFESAFSREPDTGKQVIDDIALDLTVVVEDSETGEDIELPPVRVVRSRPARPMLP